MAVQYKVVSLEIIYTEKKTNPVDCVYIVVCVCVCTTIIIKENEAFNLRGIWGLGGTMGEVM